TKHAEETNIHQQLQQLFTEWKMTEAAAKEEAIVAKLKVKEEAELKKYQQEMEKKNAKPQTSAAPIPAKAATK
ncbi:MAG: hypothetical protein PVH64_11250, partial [Bacillota bacterium]